MSNSGRHSGLDDGAQKRTSGDSTSTTPLATATPVFLGNLGSAAYSPAQSSPLNALSPEQQLLRGKAGSSLDPEMIPITSRQLSNLREQGFPLGLAREVCSAKALFPIRFWVIDNSGSMLTPDGKTVRESADGNKFSVVQCTRWSELQSAVRYHITLASLLQSTTIFRFLNDPGVRAGPQVFGIAQQYENSDDKTAAVAPEATSDEAKQKEMKVALQVVDKVEPKGATPLTFHLQAIRSHVEAMESVLIESGQTVSIVLATDGLPTDQFGDSTEMAQHEFILCLKALQSLPVWIVVRLCTDDSTVVSYYNNLDATLELPLEVIDDSLGEAEEIQEHNPWLNYATPLHRCREMGYHHRIFDLLDERLLNKDELVEFIQILWGRAALQDCPDVHMDWKGFSAHVGQLVASEPSRPHYNPRLQKRAPWIDMKQLDKCYKKNFKNGSNNNTDSSQRSLRLSRLFGRNKSG